MYNKPSKPVVFKMTYVEELLKLPVESKNEIKKLENIKQKLLNAKWSKIFNEICIKDSY